VRDKLESHGLNLPAELEDVMITEFLSDLSQLALLSSGPLSGRYTEHTWYIDRGLVR
jgi:hypothetical protein